MKLSPERVKRLETCSKVGIIKLFAREMSCADLETMRVGKQLLPDMLAVLGEEDLFWVSSGHPPSKAEVFHNVGEQLSRLIVERSNLSYKPALLKEYRCPWCFHPLVTTRLNPSVYCDQCAANLLDAVFSLSSLFACDADLSWMSDEEEEPEVTKWKRKRNQG